MRSVMIGTALLALGGVGYAGAVGAGDTHDFDSVVAASPDRVFTSLSAAMPDRDSSHPNPLTGYAVTQRVQRGPGRSITYQALNAQVPMISVDLRIEPASSPGAARLIANFDADPAAVTALYPERDGRAGAEAAQRAERQFVSWLERSVRAIEARRPVDPFDGSSRSAPPQIPVSGGWGTPDQPQAFTPSAAPSYGDSQAATEEAVRRLEEAAATIEAASQSAPR